MIVQIDQSSSSGGIADGQSSTAFCRWCAGGVVRGSDSKPLVLYHGTRTPDMLTSFTLGGGDGSIQSGDSYGVGAYLTSCAREASSYGRDGGAVLPVFARGELLDVDGALSPAQAERVTALAAQILLPSDKARFDVGRAVRRFDSLIEAREFFDTQRKNWEVFGDRMDRARPEAISDELGFGVEYTDFDAAVIIKTGREAFTFFNAVGWGNLTTAGFDGLVMEREAGARWVVLHRPDGNVKSAVGNSGAFDPLSASLTDHSPKYLVLTIEDLTTSAFEDAGRGQEIARITREMLLRHRTQPDVVFDLNGNVVGHVALADSADLRSTSGRFVLAVEVSALTRELIEQLCDQLDSGAVVFPVLASCGSVVGGVVSHAAPLLEPDVLVDEVMEI